MKISKKNAFFFLIPKELLIPKNRFLGQKVCPVARVQTDIHESEYRGHPFMVSILSHQPIIKDRSINSSSSRLEEATVAGAFYTTQ